MKTVSLRALAPCDIPSVFRIQSSSRDAAQWSEDVYRTLGSAGEDGWVAELEGDVAGFVVVRMVAEEIEILNLAVNPSLLRQGIGAVLLRHALERASAKGVRPAFLEVRASNFAAQQLYRACGFTLAGTRQQYYRVPDEDALILSRTLDEV